MAHGQSGVIASYTLPKRLKSLAPLFSADFKDALSEINTADDSKAIKKASKMLKDYGPYYMSGVVFGVKLEVSSVSNKSDHDSGAEASAAIQAEYTSGITSGKMNGSFGYTNDKASSK